MSEGGELPLPNQSERAPHTPPTPLEGIGMNAREKGVQKAIKDIDERNKDTTDYDELKQQWIKEIQWLADQKTQGNITEEQHNEFLGSVIAELQSNSELDPLTKLKRRNVVIERANSYLSHALRRNETVSVVMFDLDYFKQINDDVSHEAGDNVLRAFAKHFKFRTDDVTGRWGGEEFLAVLPNTTAEEAATLVKRFMDTLPTNVRNSLTKMGQADLGRDITASIGISDSSQLDWEARRAYGDPRLLDSDFEQLVASADTALYASKNDGRDRAAYKDASNGEMKFVKPTRPTQA